MEAGSNSGSKSKTRLGRRPGLADDQRRGEYHAQKKSTAPINAPRQSDIAGDGVASRGVLSCAQKNPKHILQTRLFLLRMQIGRKDVESLRDFCLRQCGSAVNENLKKSADLSCFARYPNVIQNLVAYDSNLRT